MENSIELREGFSPSEVRGDHSPEFPTSEHVENEDGHSLAPCDGGVAAWRLLLAAFVFEALWWGFPLSFGVFQNYYSQLPEFENDRYISTIGSTASGIAYLAAPFMISMTKRFSRYRRLMIVTGWPICLASLVAGSFSQSIGPLIFTQGIMYGVGFVLFEYPIISLVNEYWVVRRGMAYGILCSASGVSGAAMPFCIQVLLQNYGYPTTLRAIAVGLFVLTGPLIPLLKGRIPETEAAASTRTDWSFLRAPIFWFYTTSNLAMGLGYFFPSLYLPSYATSNGMTSTQGALLLAIMSVSQVLGQITFGYLSDRRLPLDLFTTSSALVAAVAAYACWGPAHTFGILIAFALVYGFFGAGYTAMWARMGTAINAEPAVAFTAYGTLNFGKGIGNVLAGPLSGALLLNDITTDSYGANKYSAIILFTGSCMFLSAAIIATRHVGALKRLL